MDIMVIAFGAGRLQRAANAIADILVWEGALVSPKSKLTPVDCVDWIGKQFKFGAGPTVLWMIIRWFYKMFATSTGGWGLSAQNEILRRFVFNWSTASSSSFLC